VSTNRLESFSDGVIAVAITLLVLNLIVPDPSKTAHLADALGHRWPAYAAYAISFITIGIIWINHHVMIGRLQQTDRLILILNLLLLMTIVVLPFATDLMATYLKQGSGQHLAAVIYGGSLLLMSISFATLNAHILLRKAHMHRTKLPFAERRRILARSLTGLLPYAIATALGVVSQYATLAICAAIAVYYALPVGSGDTVRTLDANSPVG
jgi:uncharacterized membrane protein